LNDVLPQSWREKVIYSHISFGSSQGYYEALLPFPEVIRLAAREKKTTESMKLGDKFHGVEMPPYFLMLLEHPGYYYRSCFGAFSDLNDGVHVLRDAGYSYEEKSIAILGMSQLGIQCEDEVEDYAFFIEQACAWYRKGQLSLEHLYQLFKCDSQTFYKYPFFILAYKNKSIQEALATFIAVPTIPEGLKAIARKTKNGTLATKEEMAYMEGYRQFRKTHFTLYETIPPR
jgi:hypothetical protein